MAKFKNNKRKNQIYSKLNYVRKRKRKYRLFLKTYKLESKTFNYASEVDKKNILLKNFNFLIRLSNQNEDSFIDNMNIIRLLSSKLFYLSTNILDAEIMIQLDDTVDDILNKLNLVHGGENLEHDVIKEFNFSDAEKENYFNFNDIYSKLAITFAAPFIQSKHYYSYYEYGYYLSMFLNLHYFANEEIILKDNTVFLTKLRIQQKMINSIRTITPSFFNLFILRTNSWLSKINFKKLNKEGGKM